MGHKSVSSSTRLIAGAVAAAAVGVVPVANAEIELGEGFSATGFVDMSLYDTEGSKAVFGIDQVEVDFKFAGSNGISAQVDVEFGEDESELGLEANGPADDATFVEQAFVSKAFTDEFSMKAGRFLSYSGWETEEPTGLFQYSGVGYAKYFYGYYQQGISAAYSGEKFSLMGSVVTDVFGYANGAVENSTDDIGYELGVAIMPIEGLTAKLFYMSDEKTDRDVINFWASYAVNGFTFAGEYNDGDFGPAGEGTGYLLMANYATGPFGFTVRYHDWDIENALGVSTDKVKGFTLSPSYKAGDNLLLVAEFRSDDVSGGSNVESIALEALFTF